MSDWRITKLRDLCTLITKGTTPSTLGHPFTTSGINFVKAEAVTPDGFIDCSTFTFVDQATHETVLKRSRLEEGDVLFSMAGVYIGKTAVVPSSILPANTNQAVGIIRCDRMKADPRFIHYYLKNPRFNEYLNSLVAQSAQPNLNLTEIGDLPIRHPNLAEQGRIADILSTLDERIATNRRTNHLLEEMSQALFKSWFVDFDPVVAKSEGRKPFGMSDDIAALFPDSFEESELGAVPKGWRVVETGHITDIQNGFAFKSDWWKPQGTPVVKIGSVKSGYVDVADASYLDSSKAAEFQAYELEEGDILIGLTGYPGEVGLVPRSIPKPLLNQRVGKFTPKRGIYRSFVYTMTRQSEFREQVEQRAHGTAQLNVSTGGILSIKCVIPSEELFEVFDELVRPMITKILNCFAESSQLSKARDMLLPELLGGGINETAHVTEPTAA